MPALKANALAVSLVEGWRGEICHVAATDQAGRFDFYKVADPSFHNWFGVALALRHQEISDFPLCNKSFNLSGSSLFRVGAPGCFHFDAQKTRRKAVVTPDRVSS